MKLMHISNGSEMVTGTEVTKQDEPLTRKIKINWKNKYFSSCYCSLVQFIIPCIS